MLDIKLRVRYLWIFKRNIKTIFPEDWHELTYKMVKPVSNMLSLFFFANPKKKERKQFYEQTLEQRLYLIYPFLGIKHKLLFKLDTYQLNALAERTGFIVSDNKQLNSILLPEFKFRGKRYHGPLHRLSNVKFGEFIQADTYFMNYYDTDDDKYIYLLIACLYRPQKKKLNTESSDYDGDVREVFNQYQVKKRAEHFNKLPKHLVDSIFFNYHTIRKWLTERYIYVFGNYESNTKESDNTGFKESKRNDGWKGIIKNMASTVLEIDKYAEQNMHNVLDDLDDKILNDMKK